MEKEHVNQFIALHGSKFAPEVLPSVKRKLESVSDDRFDEICATDFKNPTTILLFALFLGMFGIDRFMLGDTGKGILKILTAGFCCIGMWIDVFNSKKRTSEYNVRMLDMAL
ncbi:MAG: TM2 domain-containing protein [Muribaculaceae bacterium]